MDSVWYNASPRFNNLHVDYVLMTYAFFFLLGGWKYLFIKHIIYCVNINEEQKGQVSIRESCFQTNFQSLFRVLEQNKAGKKSNHLSG